MPMAMNSSTRNAVMNWFETEFQKAVSKTTKIAREEDGRINYNFSVNNNSGFDFNNFSFKVTINDNVSDAKIASAVIKAKEWHDGETKNFKSRIKVPQNVKNISFVIHPSSLEFDAQPALGGAPETTVTKTTTVQTARGTTTTTKTTTRNRRDGTVTTEKTTTRTGGTYGTQGGTNTYRQTRPVSSFANMKQEKKMNKMRLGKSGWSNAWLIFATLFILAAFGSDLQSDILTFGVIGLGCLGIGVVLKILNSRKAKRIRFYEAKVNRTGNTSIDELGLHMGRRPDQVADDLQTMIVEGFFPDAYVDMNNRLLVMTRNGEPMESVEKSAAINKKARRKAAREKGLVPDDIDELIVMTDDAQLKTKLTQLRSITDKIDRRVEERPELADQVKEFREKYYPEVVRLTDEYNEKIANLDAEMAEENVSDEPKINTPTVYLQKQAKEIKTQLTKLINSVIEASENLFEKLHEDDITDISTDIQTLQATLASKGLLDSDFDL